MNWVTINLSLGNTDSARRALEEEIYHWCERSLVPGEWRYCGKYTESPYSVSFKNTTDVLAFNIKFSNNITQRN